MLDTVLLTNCKLCLKMSLVAYDSSDDEKEEEIFKTKSPQTTNSKQSSAVSVKRQREGVKITIPSLKEFEEEESLVAPKKQKSQSGSGLFSLLPPPKNTPILKKTNFVPYVLSSKKEALQPVSKKCTPKTTETNKSGVLEEQNSESETSLNEEVFQDEENSTTCKDFFSLESLSSSKKVDNIKCPSPNYSVETNSSLATPEAYNSIHNKPSSIPSSHSQQENLYVQPFHSQEEIEDSEQMTLVHSEELNSSINPCTDNVTDISHGKSLLNDKEFLKLQGRRREFEAVDIIDVNGDDQLTGRNEWLMKSLTEESTHRPSKKKHNMPTQQQKRKHQITYLAFQAKEREMDLKNQWALNSRTRRETQAKYGF